MFFVHMKCTVSKQQSERIMFEKKKKIKIIWKIINSKEKSKMTI